MDTDIYRFKIGAFECIAVSDGTFTYAPPTFPLPATLLFANAPKESLEQTLHQYGIRSEDWNAWVSPYICLVVNTGDNLVIVDTGAGGLDASTGKLIQNLHEAGIRPEDIDTVILTHGHPDHIGGNIDAYGKPAFSKARYVMWKDEWDFWTAGKAEQELDEHSREVLLRFANDNLPPIKDQLHLVDHEIEIVPGILALAGHGHTSGHMALSISSMGKHLLCVSDAVLHPIHLEHPEWHAVVDSTPIEVLTTRRQLLSRAVAEKAIVFAFHFPFPGLGYVSQKVSGWQWHSIETMA